MNELQPPMADGAPVIPERPGDIFVAFDAQMNYRYLNAAAAALLGRPAHELVGEHWSREHLQVGTPLHSAILRALRAQQPLRFEEYFPPMGRWFEQRLYPSPSGLEIFLIDVTARKEAEAVMPSSNFADASRSVVLELIRRERDFSNALLDSLPGVFYCYNRELQFLRWNKNFEQVTGYTGAEITRLTPLDFFGGVDKELIAERIAHVFSAGSAHAEANFIAKDGSAIPYFFTGRRTEVDGQECLIGVGVDISEREQARALLEERERHLSLIFDTVGDVIFMLEVEQEDRYRFVAVNPIFLAVTGLAREQVVGKLMEEVLPPTAHELVRNNYRQAIQVQRTVRWEEASAYPTGTLYGEVAVTPAVDATGRCTHLIGSVHDITQIRRAEEEIRALNQELEQRVIARTQQLEAANKELESFSYSVSHDLRAPLRAISGFAEIIARRHRASLNEQGQHYFDNIVQASERMSHLIDDLLTYSRIGRGALRRMPIALDELLARLAGEFAGRVEAVGGTLSLIGPPAVVAGDLTVLSQIFTNLLENALAYRRPEVPLLIVVRWQVEQQAVALSVEDNGIGIAPEYHEKIFNMFQRLHSEDDYPGTGIGLATVKKSVELLGGSIWVESELGAGASFKLRLPKE